MNNQKTILYLGEEKIIPGAEISSYLWSYIKPTGTFIQIERFCRDYDYVIIDRKSLPLKTLLDAVYCTICPNHKINFINLLYVERGQLYTVFDNELFF